MADNGNSMKAVSNNLLRAKQDADLSALSYGKVQPQAIEMEEAVIGAILIDKDGLSKVNETLHSGSFYKKAHGIIFDAAQELYETNNPVDLLTVKDMLRKKNLLEEAGGIAYLAQLSNKVTSSANAEYCARIIQQKYILRELISGSSNTINDAFEDSKDVFEILSDAEKLIYDISQDNLRKGPQEAGFIAAKLLKEVSQLAENQEDVVGVTTGFRDLDKFTHGWQKSDLIIIAARPGMGKTSFTLGLARNAAAKKIPIAFFSLEMSNSQLVQRILSMQSEIPLGKLRKADIEEYEWPKLQHGVEALTEMPIFVDDTPSISVNELRSKCRRLKMQEDIQLVIIDYLQLMTGSQRKNGTREQEISSISRALKAMAKELDVPVIALSQLSRAVETRSANKRPMLSDLRESGAIEQDADIVTFLYRPEYYEAQDGETEEEQGYTEVIISKHRNGPLGTVNLKFLSQFTKFVDMDESVLGNDISSPYNPGIMITRQSKMNDDFDDNVPF